MRKEVSSLPTIVVLLILVFARYANAQESGIQDRRAAQTLFCKIVEAHGGRERIIAFLNKPHMYSGTAKWQSSGRVLRCSMLTKNRDSFFSYDDDHFVMRDAYESGKRSFSLGDLSYAGSSLENLDENRTEKHQVLSLLCAPPESLQLELVPDQTVDGVQCNGIRFDMGRGDYHTLFADKDTHLVVKSLYPSTPSPSGELWGDKTLLFSNYKPVDSVEVPWSFSFLRTRDGNAALIRHVDWNSIEEFAGNQHELDARFRARTPKVLSIDVPFQFEHGQIVIPIILNGSLRKFVVDTGSSAIVIRGAGVRVSKRITDRSDGKDVTSTTLDTVDSFQLADQVFHDIPAVIQPTSDAKDLSLLGMDFLRQFVITINFKARTINLTSSTKGAPVNNAGERKVPFLLDKSLFLKGCINGSEDEVFLFDTGGANAVTLLTLPKRFTDIHTTTYAINNEHEIQKFRTVRIESMRLGSDLVFRDISASIPEPVHHLPCNILGLSLFRSFDHVRLNFPAELLEVW